MNKKNILLVIAVIAVILIVFLLGKSEVNTPTTNTLKNISAETVNTNAVDGFSMATSTDGNSFVYTNNKYGLKFEYPVGWHVGDIGESWLQLFNYDESLHEGDFKKDSEGNKIEIHILDVDKYDSGQSDIYTEKNRQESTTSVANQDAVHRMVELTNGVKVSVYNIQIPDYQNKILVMSIVGNPDNFIALDNIISTITWIK